MPAPARFLLGALALIGLLIGGCDTPTSSAPGAYVTTPTTTAAAPTSISTTSSSSSNGGVVEHAPVDGEAATIATITDGDTFQLTDGRKVRVLGIDSCEDTGAKKTPGGADATSQAEYLLETLSGGQVTLVTQPGAPDVDGWDRLLRYVRMADGADFGVAMVGYDHTGIYTDSKGRHGDASQAYIDELYAHDLDHAANPPSGRECGEFPPPVDAPDPDDHYVPVPDNDDDDHHHGRRHFCGRWNPFC